MKFIVFVRKHIPWKNDDIGNWEPYGIVDANNHFQVSNFLDLGVHLTDDDSGQGVVMSGTERKRKCTMYYKWFQIDQLPKLKRINPKRKKRQ